MTPAGILEYGYEYRGCGQPDLVVTPITERAMLALFTTLAAHTSPLLMSKFWVLSSYFIIIVAFLLGASNFRRKWWCCLNLSQEKNLPFMKYWIKLSLLVVKKLLIIQLDFYL